MPGLIMAANEGEHAIFSNTLNTFGNADGKRRGSVLLTTPQTMFYTWTDAEDSDDTWVHVRLAKAGTGVPNNSVASTFIIIDNAAGNFMAGIRQSSSFDGNLAIKTRWAASRTGGDGLQGPTQYGFAANTFLEIDFRFRISTVTNANDTLTVDFYINQQLRESYTTTDASGWTRPRSLELRYLNPGFQSAPTTIYYSDIIVSDGVPTVGMELITLVPSSAGNYTGFTNDYTNIDEAGFNFNDIIFTTTTNTRESWVYATPTYDPSDKVIYAFVSTIVCQTDLAGVVADFQPFLRISATDYAGTNVGADNIAPLPFINVWTENPNTTAPWVIGDFTGLESGVLSV